MASAPIWTASLPSATWRGVWFDVVSGRPQGPVFPSPLSVKSAAI